MTIGLLKESSPETRVSLLPEAVASLTKKNITVLVETAAGEKAFSENADYEKAGAAVVAREQVLQSADLLLSINAPTIDDTAQISKGILLGVYQPLLPPLLFHAPRHHRV